jgi:hypothetical protein
MSNKKNEARIWLDMKGDQVSVSVNGTKMNLGILLTTAVSNVKGLDEVVLQVAEMLKNYKAKQHNVESENEKEA